MRNLAEIHRPTTIAEAVQLIQRPAPKTAVLAGGTTLVGQSDPTVEAVVDLSEIADLRGLHTEADSLRLGAMLTLNDLTTPAVSALAGGALSRAAAHATSSLLRRQATLGGALLSGEAPELAVVLIALGAEVIMYDPAASRRPLETLYHDGGEATGLLTGIVIPRRARLGFATHAVRRTPTDAPLVCVAASVSLSNGTVERIGLSAGGVLTPAPETPTQRRVAGWPVRLAQAEAAAHGQALTNQLINQAVTLAISETPSLTDYRASADYRQAMVGVLLRRSLGDAWRAALDVG